MMRLLAYLRPAVIVGPLPVTLVNGTVPDANQVMSDFQWIVNEVNANATQGAGSIAKNVIYNGDMSLAQRIGTNGSLAISAGTKAYTLDRWQVSIPALGAGTVAQFGTTGLAQFASAMRVQRTAANTGTAAITFAQSMETVDSVQVQGQTVTLSFWARAGANYSASGNAFVGQLWTGTGTDENVLTSYTGGAATINQSFTITNSWARYQASAALPSTLTEFAVLFSFTPTGTAGAADNVDITGVQVEIGSSASAYDFRPFSENLARCQRYYQKSFEVGTAPASNTTSNCNIFRAMVIKSGASAHYWSLGLPVRMRDGSTTGVIYNPAANNNEIRDVAGTGLDFSDSLVFTIGITAIFQGLANSSSVAGDQVWANWSLDCDLV